ncbi:MAG: hypothetical protein ACREOO_14350 [bacterium]
MFQPAEEKIIWRLHLRSSLVRVYEMLSTDRGRARFWAESAVEKDGVIHFIFPNAQRWEGKIVARQAPNLFAVEYIGDSLVRFELNGNGNEGTLLTLIDAGVAAPERTEVIAGWVSVLLALKAAADFDVDLRNHNTNMTWDQSFVEN